jgi:tetratricopeptide (TPR) repeat protein
VDEAKKNYRLIREAYSTLNKKKFQEAIAVLEKVLSSGAGDIYVLLLLSVAYLHTDQFGKLARFITKIKEKNPEYLPLVQLEAYLKLKSTANYSDALRLYIDLAVRYPADTHIHRGRNLIQGNAADFPEFQKNARLQDFVYIPRPPKPGKGRVLTQIHTGLPGKPDTRTKKDRRYTFKRAVRIIIIFCALALGAELVWYVAGSTFFHNALLRVKKPRYDFSSIDSVSVSGTDYDLVKKNINRDRIPVYYESARDMAGDFNHARRLIKSEKYNEAALLLNRLYSSNINFIVKEKVDFLIKFVINAEDRDFAEIPYRNVSEKKYLYRGYAVRWSGTITRIKEKDDSQIITMRIGGDIDGGGEADVYSRKIVPGLKKGSSILMEGVIVDFLGRDKIIYVVSQNIRLRAPNETR